MSNPSSLTDREELARLKRERELARDNLAALDQTRAACHGFTLDPFDDEYRRAVQRYDRACQHLAETQRQLTVSPAARAFVPRVIAAIRAR
jgi:hypothetical protein